nr:DNA helicase Pif1-like protein [Tanacetum cinerariifolium]
MFVEFVIQNQFFSYSLEDFAQILDIPCEGACAFTDRWSLDELAYGVPSDGPYQTNPPFPDDIISSIRIDREERKPRKDCGTRRGRHSTSSYTFNEPSLSYLNDDDGNNEGTSCASTPSPISYDNSLTIEVPQVFQNAHNIDPHLEQFYTRQIKIKPSSPNSRGASWWIKVN